MRRRGNVSYRPGTYAVIPCPEQLLAVVEGDGRRRPRERRLIRARRRKGNATDLDKKSSQQACPVWRRIRRQAWRQDIVATASAAGRPDGLPGSNWLGQLKDTTRTHLVPVSVHYFLQVTSYEGRVRWEHKLYTTRGREYTRRRDQRWIVEEMAPPRSCANDLPQACCNAGPGFGAEVGCIRSQRTSVFLQVALFRESEGRTLLICLLSNSHARSQSSQF